MDALTHGGQVRQVRCQLCRVAAPRNQYEFVHSWTCRRFRHDWSEMLTPTPVGIRFAPAAARPEWLPSTAKYPCGRDCQSLAALSATWRCGNKSTRGRESAR